tara:strand:+ start:341 stop:496 length:156 start_codon:yes stop_codon:yes gene_type:complete
VIRSKIQDRKLIALVKGEVDVKLNSFGLKIRKLENEVRSLRSQVKKLKKGE